MPCAVANHCLAHELMFKLVWKNIADRYKQVYPCVSWAVIKPGTLMLMIFTLMRGFAGIDSFGMSSRQQLVKGKLVVQQDAEDTSNLVDAVYIMNPLSEVIDAVLAVVPRGTAPDLTILVPGMAVVADLLPLSDTNFLRADSSVPRYMSARGLWRLST